MTPFSIYRNLDIIWWKRRKHSICDLLQTKNMNRSKIVRKHFSQNSRKSFCGRLFLRSSSLDFKVSHVPFVLFNVQRTSMQYCSDATKASNCISHSAFLCIFAKLNCAKLNQAESKAHALYWSVCQKCYIIPMSLRMKTFCLPLNIIWINFFDVQFSLLEWLNEVEMWMRRRTRKYVFAFRDDNEIDSGQFRMSAIEIR